MHAEQIRQWCGNPDAQITVKPVIDLNEHIDVEAYEIRGRLREQTILTHPTCVFPWCTRPARALEPDEHDADCDHRVPYAMVRHSCSCNAAPLCRRHHRAKTHGGWTYTALERGTYVWTSPHGYQYLRDHHGTLDVSRDRHPPAAPAGPLHPPPRTTDSTAPNPAGPPPAGTSSGPLRSGSQPARPATDAPAMRHRSRPLLRRMVAPRRSTHRAPRARPVDTRPGLEVSTALGSRRADAPVSTGSTDRRSTPRRPQLSATRSR